PVLYDYVDLQGFPPFSYLKGRNDRRDLIDQLLLPAIVEDLAIARIQLYHALAVQYQQRYVELELLLFPLITLVLEDADDPIAQFVFQGDKRLFAIHLADKRYVWQPRIELGVKRFCVEIIIVKQVIRIEYLLFK